MARVYSRFSLSRAFTILELLVVIAILGILMGMVTAFRPSTERTETKALILNLGISIEQYHSSFYVYPRSGGNGYLDDTGALKFDSSGKTDFYWMLTRKDMVQRDGKYVEQLFVPDENTFTEDAGGDTYFLDGWGRRLVYYSGAELVSDPGSSGTPMCMPNWLRASKKITSGNVAQMAGRYRADEFWFLGSAGTDEKFQWDVVQNAGGGGEAAHDPANYTYQVLSSSTNWDKDGPGTNINSLGAPYDDDDLWNYSLMGDF